MTRNLTLALLLALSTVSLSADAGPWSAIKARKATRVQKQIAERQAENQTHQTTIGNNKPGHYLGKAQQELDRNNTEIAALEQSINAATWRERRNATLASPVGFSSTTRRQLRNKRIRATVAGVALTAATASLAVNRAWGVHAETTTSLRGGTAVVQLQRSGSWNLFNKSEARVVVEYPDGAREIIPIKGGLEESVHSVNLKDDVLSYAITDKDGKTKFFVKQRGDDGTWRRSISSSVVPVSITNGSEFSGAFTN